MSKTGIRTVERKIGKRIAVRHFLSHEQTCEECGGAGGQVVQWPVLPGTVTDTEPGCIGWNRGSSRHEAGRGASRCRERPARARAPCRSTGWAAPGSHVAIDGSIRRTAYMFSC